MKAIKPKTWKLLFFAGLKRGLQRWQVDNSKSGVSSIMKSIVTEKNYSDEKYAVAELQADNRYQKLRKLISGKPFCTYAC